jgi:hypothetical protein
MKLKYDQFQVLQTNDLCRESRRISSSQNFLNLIVAYWTCYEPGYLRQYSAWLRAGRPWDRGSIPGRGKGFFLLPLCPDWLWGPPSLLSNGYRGVPFPGGKRGRGVTLTTHLHLVPRSSMRRSYTSSHPSASMACSGTALLFSLNMLESLIYSLALAY